METASEAEGFGGLTSGAEDFEGLSVEGSEDGSDDDSSEDNCCRLSHLQLSPDAAASESG